MATRGNIAEKSFDAETGILRFLFSDKTEQVLNYRELAGPEVWDTIPLVVRESAGHGGGQKGGDSYASAGKKAPDAGLTPLAWAKQQCKAVLDAIRKGDWSRAGSGGGGEPALIVQALANLKGSTVEQAEAYIDGLTDVQVAALRARKDMTKEITAIQAARAKAKADRAAEAAAKAAEAVQGTEEAEAALPDFEVQATEEAPTAPPVA